MTKALAFIQTQLEISNTKDELIELEQWMNLSKKLTKHKKFKFTPKINITFPIPLRKIYKEFKNYEDKYSDSVIEIWQNSDNWKLLYKSDRYSEF